MKTFEIEFLVGKKNHSALIHRVEADPDKGQLTLYTTHEIEPALPIQMITFAVIENNLTWSVQSDQHSIARAMANSIISKVQKLGIPLSDNAKVSTPIANR